jgi:hypothetical protein
MGIYPGTTFIVAYCAVLTAMVRRAPRPSSPGLSFHESA